MEYVQFHPTTLFHNDADGFLISEAVRGEGARLLTKNGFIFMEKYSPLGDLAPRDQVCRAMYEEMIKRGDSYVYLDVASYSKIDVRKRFPAIYEKCLSLGIDMAKDPVPVVPAAHYSCGGVHVDLWGRTSLKNLYAVGEVSATGLHGANRLASTSLLEGLVWGLRAGQHVVEHLEQRKSYKESDIPAMDIPRPGGRGGPGPHSAGLAQHQVDHVELCGHHTDREEARDGPRPIFNTSPPELRLLPQIAPQSDDPFLEKWRSGGLSRGRSGFPQPEEPGDTFYCLDYSVLARS